MRPREGGSREGSRSVTRPRVAPWREGRYVLKTFLYIVGLWAVMLTATVVALSLNENEWGDDDRFWLFAAYEGVLLLVLAFCATWMVARTPETWQPGDEQPVKARKVE